MKIELPGIEFSEAIRVKVRLVPKDEEEKPTEFIVDGIFSRVSTFYPFIPASQIPTTFRRFWIQVALIVNNTDGPFNPREVSGRQFVGK